MPDSLEGDGDPLFGPDEKGNAWTECGDEALIDAAAAVCRLLKLAEGKISGRQKRIAQFFSAVGDSTIVVWPPRDMQADDLSINDDMLLALNALRWHRAALMVSVPDGEERVWQVIRKWRASSTYPAGV
ncbi:MAG: hypothetical protein AB8C46_06340 [Burkholderiaceae bacterium]